MTEELIAGTKLDYGMARRLLGDLAYRSGQLREILAEMGILLSTERSQRRPGVRQRVEIAISSLKRVFGVGETLATTLVGLATRIAAKICAPTLTPSWSTRGWVDFEVASRSYGHEPCNRLLEGQPL